MRAIVDDCDGKEKVVMLFDGCCSGVWMRCGCVMQERKVGSSEGGGDALIAECTARVGGRLI